MTYSDSGRRDTLHYRLISGSTEDPGLWGNEYVRHLAAELGEEYLAASTAAEDDEVAKPAETAEESTTEPAEKESTSATAGPKSGISASAPTWPAVDRPTLLALALEIVPFFLSHNAEADAVDLLLELEAIERIVPLVGKDTFARVCLYMVSCVLVPCLFHGSCRLTACTLHFSRASGACRCSCRRTTSSFSGPRRRFTPRTAGIRRR